MTVSVMSHVARFAAAVGEAFLPAVVSHTHLAAQQAEMPARRSRGRVSSRSARASRRGASACRRSGVILLIVLGVLVVFALAVLMFVISARQHKVSSNVHQKVE